MTRAAVASIAALIMLASCGEDQAFRIDDRVTIVAPRERAIVTLPVKLQWSAHDLGDRSFAVYVDRAPVRPGARVIEAREPRSAVYRTDLRELVIHDVHQGQGSGRERHTATVVLVDSSGHRAGESAWQVVFEVDRKENQ